MSRLCALPADLNTNCLKGSSRSCSACSTCGTPRPSHWPWLAASPLRAARSHLWLNWAMLLRFSHKSHPATRLSITLTLSQRCHGQLAASWCCSSSLNSPPPHAIASLDGTARVSTRHLEPQPACLNFAGHPRDICLLSNDPPPAPASRVSLILSHRRSLFLFSLPFFPTTFFSNCCWPAQPSSPFAV